MTLEGLECVNSPFSPHLLPCWGSRGKLGTLPGGIIFTKRPPYTSLVHLRMCHSVEMLMRMKVSWTGLPPHLKPIYTPGGIPLHMFNRISIFALQWENVPRTFSPKEHLQWICLKYLEYWILSRSLVSQRFQAS